MKNLIRGLYPIADNTFRAELSPVQLAEAYLKGGAKIVQLRMKSEIQNSQSEVYQYARDIMRLKQGYDFILIVNDFVEVALEVGADGVHVGVDDMPVGKVRERVGRDRLIGYSSHSLEEAVAAEQAGADYIAFGAVFPTKTKGPGHPVQGLEKLRPVVQTLTIPVVAIGGIDRQNFESVLETGVAAVAMITALTKAKDIAQETNYYATCFSHRRL